MNAQHEQYCQSCTALRRKLQAAESQIAKLTKRLDKLSAGVNTWASAERQTVRENDEGASSGPDEESTRAILASVGRRLAEARSERFTSETYAHMVPALQAKVTASASARAKRR